MAKTHRILVIGLGRLGESLVRHLAMEQAEIIALDNDRAHVDAMKEFCHLAIQGDGSDIDTLIEIGADKVDSAVICMGESFESSVLALTNLLELKVPRIDVRASTAKKATIYKKIGAHGVFYVEEEMGKIMAHRICRKSVLHELELDGGLKLIEWNPAPWAIDKSLMEINLPAEYRIQLIGLRDSSNSNKFSDPDPHTIIRKGMSAILVGSEKDLQRLLARHE